jgi:rhodanese-related sulfurtransferase
MSARVISVFILTLSCLCQGTESKAQLSLSLLEKTIERIHPVPSITHDSLTARLATGDSVLFVLFDTRSQEEYETSHIRKAIRLDPEISPEDFEKAYAKMIRDKQLVFYCSVGYRSSASIQRLNDSALEAKAISLLNLRGGIFRWYNENNPVVNNDGITDEIHPYSSAWGFLIKKRKKD